MYAFASRLPRFLALVAACAMLTACANARFDDPWWGGRGATPQRTLAFEQAFWTELGGSMPRSDTMVVLHLGAAHHFTTEWSFVAVRDAAGAWRVEGIGQQTSGLLKIEPETLHQSGVLKAAVARRLDESLSSWSLWSEPSGMGISRDAGVGSSAADMMIITPSRWRRSTWVGRLGGRAGAVADMVLGE